MISCDRKEGLLRSRLLNAGPELSKLFRDPVIRHVAKEEHRIAFRGSERFPDPPGSGNKMQIREDGEAAIFPGFTFGRSELYRNLCGDILKRPEVSRIAPCPDMIRLPGYPPPAGKGERSIPCRIDRDIREGAPARQRRFSGPPTQYCQNTALCPQCISAFSAPRPNEAYLQIVHDLILLRDLLSSGVKAETEGLA